MLPGSSYSLERAFARNGVIYSVNEGLSKEVPYPFMLEMFKFCLMKIILKRFSEDSKIYILTVIWDLTNFS